jgi:formamidopyrimidine-DNA glycosylase
LMDQQAVAGLGNIYCDEALHAAGLHPLTKAGALDSRAADRLLRAIKSTLRRAIRHKGSTMMDYRTAGGANGSFQKYHRVYRRTDQPCHSCGTKIERITAAGRSTFLCPKCQQYGSC